MDARLAPFFSAVYPEGFQGPMWNWAAGMKLPQSTRSKTFRPQESPWLLEIFAALSDPTIKEVVVVAPAGSAKSLLAEILIAWIVTSNPGLTYYVCQTDSDSQDAMEDRIVPMLEANLQTANLLPTDRSKKRITKIRFPTMPLYALGANLSNAQSKRVKYLVCDETHKWEPGLLEAFRARTNAVAGAKILILSTGSVTDDETDAAYQAGDRRVYHVTCPECGRAQDMPNKRMDYDTTDETMDADGNYRMAALRKTVGFLCINPECAASRKEFKWRDTDETRRRILAGAHYVKTNPNAASERASFHYPYFVVPWLSWEDGAEKWIAANRAAAFGILEPRKEYIQKWLGESWDESPREEDAIKTGHRVGKYKKRGPFPQEMTRFCSADQQRDRFYGVCQAVAQDGELRVVDAAVLQTFEEYEQFRQDNHTEAPRTGLDIAFNTSISQQRCAQYGWTGLWGDERRHWPHDQKSPWHPINLAKFAKQPWQHLSTAPVMLPFSPRQRAQAGLGLAGKVQLAYYHYWSNPFVKDTWHHLFNGLGAPFTYASDIGKLFIAQTSTEVKTLVYDKGTGRKSKWVWIVPSKKSPDEMKQDHYLDASQMGLSMILMDDRISLSRAILGGESISVPEPILEEAI